MAKMDQKYTIENGMRVYNLAEVIVTGRRESCKNGISLLFGGNFEGADGRGCKKGHFISTYDLLRRLPGITV